jgi:hypothetical protein
MSLINEALKKAQKQRTGETPPLTAMPSVGGESAARIARRGQPAGFNTLILRIGLGVAGLAIVVVAAVLLIDRKAAAPVPPPAVTTNVPAPSTQPKPGVSAPAATPSPATASVAATTSAAPATTPSTTVVFAPVEAPKPVEPAAIQPAPEPAKPAVARKLEPRAIKYIESIRVAGIRAASGDRKVLMNDRVYRIGDTVEAEMGLKLAGITVNSLTFEDENGGRYTRNF